VLVWPVDLQRWRVSRELTAWDTRAGPLWLVDGACASTTLVIGPPSGAGIPSAAPRWTSAEPPWPTRQGCSAGRPGSGATASLYGAKISSRPLSGEFCDRLSLLVDTR
jgi:hypothetical protein